MLIFVQFLIFEQIACSSNIFASFKTFQSVLEMMCINISFIYHNFSRSFVRFKHFFSSFHKSILWQIFLMMTRFSFVIEWFFRISKFQKMLLLSLNSLKYFCFVFILLICMFNPGYLFNFQWIISLLPS